MIAKHQQGLVVIEKDNDTVLFDPETFLIFTPKGKECYTESILSFLEKKSHLIRNKNIEIPFGVRPTYKKKELTIYFLTTNNCNLRCSYCFAEGGSYGECRGFMSKKTIDQSFHFLNQKFTHIDSFKILFFGGEPCLYPDLMDYAARTAKDILKNKKVSFTATTNGTILPEKVQSVLKEHDIRCGVSCDGPKCAQNFLRKTANGLGSYDLVTKNFKIFKSIQKRLPTLVTVTPKNMNLTDIYLHFKKLGVNGVRFTPATLSKDHPLAFTDQDIMTLKNEFTRLADVYLNELLTEEHPLIIINFYYIQSLLRRQRRFSYCGLGNSIISITPQGDLYPCPHFIGTQQHCLGNVHMAFDEKEFDKYFQENDVSQKPTCAACPIRNICGGDCYNYLDNKFKGPNNLTSIQCQIFEHQIHLSLWLYARLYKANFFTKNKFTDCVRCEKKPATTTVAETQQEC